MATRARAVGGSKTAAASFAVNRARRPASRSASAAALLLASAAAHAVEPLDLDDYDVLTPATTLTEHLVFGSDVDIGVITVDEGERAYVKLEAVPEWTDWLFVDRWDRIVATQPAGAVVPVRLPAGDYLVRARPNHTFDGDFQVLLPDDVRDAAWSRAATSDTIDVALAEHRRTFTWSGGWMEVQLDDGAAGLSWHVDNTVGLTVARDVTGGFSLPSGSYTLVVGGEPDDVGAYQVTVATSSAPTPPSTTTTALTLDVATTDTIEAGATHVFTFTTLADDRLTLSTQSGMDAAVVWRVLDPAGGVLTHGVGASTLGAPLIFGAGEHRIELRNSTTASIGAAFTIAETVVLDAEIAFDMPTTFSLPTAGTVA